MSSEARSVAPADGDRMADAMAALWQRHRATNAARVEVIERATLALLEAGHLDDALREEARGEAHKLAGALGTFGFSHGTDGAREAELMLRGEELNPERLAQIVVGLNEVMSEQVTGRPVGPTPATDRAPADLVLVTDDDQLADGVSAAAARSGKDVVVAGHPEPAQIDGADVVVVDLGDRYERGLGLLDSIRRRAPEVITVAVTTNETFDVRVAVAATGAIGLVPRELPPQQLLEAVDAFRADRESVTGRVLVVDDDPSVLDSVALVLGSAGLDVATVGDASACFEELVREQPALVVLDLGLPEVDGITLCRMIRADRRWSNVALLVLTSDSSPESIETAYRAGADDFLTKPVSGAVLRGRSRALLSQRGRNGSLGHAGHGVKDRAGLLEYLDALERIARRRRATFTVAAIGLLDGDDLDAAAAEAAVGRVASVLRESCRVEDGVGRWDGDRVVVGLLGADAVQTSHRVALSLGGGELTAVRRADGTEVTVGLRMGVAELSDERTGVAGLVSTALEALDDAVDLSPTRVTDPERSDADRVDVVIVDDDDVLADLLEYAVAGRGLRSHRFADGAVAAQALGEGQVSGRVILLDVGLPGMDGFSVLASLRRSGVLERSLVLVLTARSGEGETMRALELGASDHVAKPFSVPILMERVERLLRASP